jgi:hypothetical protein
MLNRALVVRGAEEIVAAAEAYRAKEGRFPAALEELVPRFLPAVPRGDIKPGASPYRLWQEGPASYFSYTPPPWPVQRIYNFQTREWRIND